MANQEEARNLDDYADQRRDGKDCKIRDGRCKPVCLVTLELGEGVFGQRDYVSNGMARRCAQSCFSSWVLNGCFSRRAGSLYPLPAQKSDVTVSASHWLTLQARLQKIHARNEKAEIVFEPRRKRRSGAFADACRVSISATHFISTRGSLMSGRLQRALERTIQRLGAPLPSFYEAQREALLWR